MRGFIFMLEAVFAGILLMGFMLFMAQGYGQSHAERSRDLGGVLQELDQRGLLGGYVYSGDLGGLEDEISIPGFSDSVQVCGPGGCTGEVPSADNVWAGYYFLAGGDSYEPVEVRLYAW